MIHRAVLGSVERFFAILVEHTAGKWPLWLSPRQVAVCTVSEAHAEFANSLASKLKGNGYQVIVDSSASTVNK